jgi:intraflagellar transport protein 56
VQCTLTRRHELTYACQLQLPQDERAVPTLDVLIDQRDFSGAITLLQVQSNGAMQRQKKAEWLAYCYFHSGQFTKALAVYEGLVTDPEADPLCSVYAASCHFYLGQFKKADDLAKLHPKSSLANRILMHCAHAQGDEDRLVECHTALSKTLLEDQLSQAAIHFRRSHFQEATDIYKRVLLEHKDYLVLNVFIALCYSRLDYYDISQEILKVLPASVCESTLVAWI